jgi:protein O-mannosyl-transferase
MDLLYRGLSVTIKKIWNKKIMSVTSNRTTWLSIILLIFVGSIIYANTLNVPFYFDDIDNIKNPALRIENASVEEVLNVLSTGTLKTRPVSNLSFALNYYLGGYRVQGYHLVNISIHLFTGIFLYLFLRVTLALPVNSRQYGRFPALALITTLIWVAHPLGTQSVTYLVQRMNSMTAMFYLLTLLLYVMGRNWKIRGERRQSYLPAWAWFLASGVSGLLAIGSKEIAATLPLVIFIYEWYFFQDLDGDWLKSKILLGVSAVFALVMFAWLYLGDNFVQRILGGCRFRDFTIIERLFTQLRVVVHYIGLLIYPNPDRIVFDYDFPLSTSLFEPLTTLYSFAFLLIVVSCIVIFARKERLISFCLLWFVVNLAIESSVICLEMVFEHRTYLPSMLFLLLVIAILYRFVKNSWGMTSFLLVVVCVFGYWTVERNKIWQDPVVFWQDSIKKYPGKYRPHINLGHALARSGEMERAEKHLRKAIALNPNSKIAFNSLGALFMKLNRREEAEYFYKQSIKREKRYTIAMLNLGTLLMQDKRYDEAIAQFRAFLKISPGEIRVEKLLGVALLRSGRDQEEALRFLSSALERDKKDTDVLVSMAEALTGLDRTNEAIQVYRDALKINPNFVQAHYNLAMLLVRDKKINQALVHYDAAVRYSTQVPPVEYNYANLLLRLGEFDKAEHYYGNYLSNSDVVADAFNNLGLVMVYEERFGDAAELFRKALALNPKHQMAGSNFQLAKELLEGAQSEQE